jgi:hypothetical protein
MTTKAPSPSVVPPPPTGGESTKIIAVVIVLALGLGGLLLWKNFGAKPPPPIVTPVTSASVAPSAPPPPLEDEIPPPPDLPEAGPDTGTRVTSTGPVGPAPGICEASSCGGTVTQELTTALAFRAKQAHRCYDTALGQDTSLMGHVKIGVRIASNGQVCSANVASNDLSNPNVASCIANMFRQSGHFPAPKGGCVDANVPISLMPPGQR